jgi:hypothetical protein
MSSVNPNLKPQGVYELQGGIERYIKSYPEGGFWKGKNYLFDRRFEQIPGNNPSAQVEAGMDSKCAHCRSKWTTYRGKFKCSQGLCGVPVIVCDDCRKSAALATTLLICELCRVGYKAPQLMPDLVGLKRKAESKSRLYNNTDNTTKSELATTTTKRAKQGTSDCKDRLFLARLPLTATKTKLASVLGGDIKVIYWLTDKQTGAFYGSCKVQLESEEDAQRVVDNIAPLQLDKKKIKVSFCDGADDTWPPANYVDLEYPPVGRYVKSVLYYVVVLYCT